MYSTCLICGKGLPKNDAIEHFPIGQRLVFDAERGRLWVVCRRCERWNLSPIEERWEAIEECERIYHDIRARVTTENIGLARHPSGLELVRIGSPLRPEFAAWRYGDQFGRRRKRAIVMGAGGAAVFGAVVIGGAAAGILGSAALSQSGNVVNLFVNGFTRARVRTEDGTLLKLKLPDLQRARILPREDGAFDIHLKKSKVDHLFKGEHATRVARSLMAGLNRAGGRKSVVQKAVGSIEAAGHPERYLEELMGNVSNLLPGKSQKKQGLISKLPAPTKLALEMALNEEQERRALQGELAFLEAAWREAEELAAIEDSLLLPEGTEEFIARHRVDSHASDEDD